MSPALPLSVSLTPDPVGELQGQYLASVWSQLLATVLVVAVGIGAVVAVRRLESRLRGRYGTVLAEVAALAVLAVLVVLGVYSLAVVWKVTGVLGEELGSVSITAQLTGQLLLSVGTVAVTYFAIRFVNRSIDKLASRNSITTHQSEVAYHVSDVAIAGVAVLLLLTIWRIDLTNIFIGAGAITAVVALTARETLTSVLAGFILLFSRPFRVGEWIQVDDGDDEDGTSGIVTDITIFHTELQTFDDKQVLIPNDRITSSTLTNYARNDQLRLEIEVGIDYDTDPERARSVAIEAVEDLAEIKPRPEPQAVTRRFGDSAILLEVHVWIENPTMRRALDARTAVIEAITAAFDREGITIPFPQRVHSAREDTEFAFENRYAEEATPSTDD
ncbi:mechanosensitive ion channel family protein [Saliphagus sp. LR7]|uniref:mechanosensitive ion channel family protein n=1 Tax=Saliphagus sp. LR7 TaxID=2282654 RepID=UPI000DF753CA|nr:mechanosensitive ion channel family protein [Saliphagus sp. LR7]